MIYSHMGKKSQQPISYKFTFDTADNSKSMGSSDCVEEPAQSPKEKREHKTMLDARDKRRVKQVSSRVLIDELRSRGFEVTGAGKT